MEDIKYGTGFLASELDHRDYKFEDKIYGASQLDNVVYEEIDLRDQWMPSAYESQGATNSCTAYATTRSLEYQINKAFYKKFNTNGFKFNNVISKRFLYYMTRYTANGDTLFGDDGGSYRNVFKSLIRTGACIQALHSDKSDISLKPTFEAVVGANDYKINSYFSIDTLQGILTSLKMGIPVLIGTNVDAFSDAKANGFSKKSETWNAVYQGNHAMLLVGVKKINNIWHFIILNSYGATWGDNESCYISIQKMWDYNLDSAWVIVLNELVMDIDTENPNYIKTQEIPNNTIILGNHAYYLDYSNNPNNTTEINDVIVNANNNVFIKTASGELINNITGVKVTLNDMISVIGNIVEFKDKNGVVSNIILKVQ